MNAPDDPLALAVLFEGGEAWLPLLKPVIEGLDDAPSFIGPARTPGIVPVRELTFQALKPNPPEAWKVVVFGQNPYPRVESATGIAMFDNTFSSWSDKRFGSVTSIRCIVKAACMQKHGVAKQTSVAELRSLLARERVVEPPEWFQAVLTQGVLLLNAALTASSDDSVSTAQHTAFWRPVIERTVEAILRAKAGAADPKHRGVVFAWWGSHAKALRKVVEKLAAKVPEVRVTHVDHCNPAAQGDAFCQGDPFGDINQELVALDMAPIDWLPDAGWRAKQPKLETADRMGAFIAETRALHELYLERLQGAGDEKLEELAAIDLSTTPLLDLEEATRPVVSLLPVLAAHVGRALEFGRKNASASLGANEIAALFLYTMESALYRRLNAALRDPDRVNVRPYLPYLRLFSAAVAKLATPSSASSAPFSLWRGVSADLRAQYPRGRVITWWGVSSCTPNASVARGFLGGAGRRTLFEIAPASAVSIRRYSAFHGEDEYVLAPGTRLAVADVAHEPNGLSHVKLVERPGERMIS